MNRLHALLLAVLVLGSGLTLSLLYHRVAVTGGGFRLHHERRAAAEAYSTPLAELRRHRAAQRQGERLRLMKRYGVRTPSMDAAVVERDAPPPPAAPRRRLPGLPRHRGLEE